MILIADGGSTKTDWIVLDNNKKEFFRLQSKGLNPTILTNEALKERIESVNKLIDFKHEIKEIHFYGAGCGTQKSCKKLNQLFSNYFKNASITVSEDMIAAVYACSQKQPAIICILGTGSNTCFYDGNTVINNAPSLGYSIMDEASGNYFGKKLLRDYFYKKMPKKIALKFKEEYNLDVDFIKENLYTNASPNMYLASLAKFMFDYKDKKYIRKLIKKGFQTYFKYQINPLAKNKNVPIYFIGSIAYYFKDLLVIVAKKNKLTVTDVIKRPIDNLVKFHQENKL